MTQKNPRKPANPFGMCVRWMVLWFEVWAVLRGEGK